MDARLRMGERRDRSKCCGRCTKENVESRAKLGEGRRGGIELFKNDIALFKKRMRVVIEVLRKSCLLACNLLGYFSKVEYKTNGCLAGFRILA